MGDAWDAVAHECPRGAKRKAHESGMFVHHITRYGLTCSFEDGLAIWPSDEQRPSDAQARATDATPEGGSG